MRFRIFEGMATYADFAGFQIPMESSLQVDFVPSATFPVLASQTRTTELDPSTDC